MRSIREITVSQCHSKCCNIPEPEFLIESMDTEKETFQLKKPHFWALKSHLFSVPTISLNSGPGFIHIVGLFKQYKLSIHSADYRLICTNNKQQFFHS